MPAIENLLGLCGERCAVRHFERKQHVQLLSQPVSVIYVALPPEVRRREAERFASGESHILVATDAIGMGLNLPIRRVLFSTLPKYDGQADRRLEVGEVHQIAGRAGRYGMHEEGFVSVLAEAEPTALREVLGVFMEQLKLDDAHFAVAELEQMLELAEALDKSAGRLTLKERFTCAQAPVDTGTEGQVDEFLSWTCASRTSTATSTRCWRCAAA